MTLCYSVLTRPLRSNQGNERYLKSSQEIGINRKCLRPCLVCCKVSGVESESHAHTTLKVALTYP